MPAIEQVGADSAVQQILTAATKEYIVAVAAEQFVPAAATDQGIVAAPAVQCVVTPVTGNRIGLNGPGAVVCPPPIRRRFSIWGRKV